MALRNRLIVMTRAPRWGVGKRRLAAGAGELAAWRFQQDNLLRLVRRLGCDPRWDLRLAVTPDRGDLPRTLSGTARQPQGGGDLGARMGRALGGGPPGPTVLIGADIPEIPPAEVARAFRLLGRHDWVFGPAEDGGYWLVGARRRPCLRRLRLPFAGVRWSRPETLDETLANLQGQSVGFVATLGDVDEAADLERLVRRR
jgi:rSAM/selenodomain-associated transferase 1